MEIKQNSKQPIGEKGSHKGSLKNWMKMKNKTYQNLRDAARAVFRGQL